jgi:hypothetical protein
LRICCLKAGKFCKLDLSFTDDVAGVIDELEISLNESCISGSKEFSESIGNSFISIFGNDFEIEFGTEDMLSLSLEK